MVLLETQNFTCPNKQRSKMITFRKIENSIGLNSVNFALLGK